ncbi:unnamed protein product [Brachionus calyciflorus]|uniref:Uncharacterized protein n=1 Tax=Brachionus calyciflorus TaxID=104777 RepID=A0A813QVR9_9BILA|nr:unnamed protein product [Brachionus calyciflorus]
MSMTTLKNITGFINSDRDSVELISDGHSNSKNRAEKSSSNMSVAYIDELIEDYARALFKSRDKDYKSICKGNGWSDLTKTIDYKKMRVRHCKPVYDSEVIPKAPKSSVLFSSQFVNDTNYDQEYLLRTERKTTSTCQINISDGYVCEKSGDLSLEVQLPGVVTEAAAGFRHEYSVEKGLSKSVEEEMTWSIESNVKVQGMSRTTADLVIHENQYSGKFEIKSYFSGKVLVHLQKDGNTLVTFEFSDLGEIFTEKKGFRKDDQGIYRITKGECKARFGIEQKIELHQYPLKN